MGLSASGRAHLGFRCRAFTLVELLVVIGIISALLAILMPALVGVRAQANGVKCQSNIRQIALALTAYCADNDGEYPPNFSLPAPGQFWYDSKRVGHYLNPAFPNAAGVVGGAAVCPDDLTSQRSYAMNVWASSKVDSFMTSSLGKRGTLWSANVPNASVMILVAERWADSGSATAGWVTTEPFGYAGLTPGVRFGVGGGLSPLVSAGPMGTANCELPFIRHRNRNSPGTSTQPVGRVTIAYADGHVEMKSNDDLADSTSGKSSLDSWWSPLDPLIN